MLLPLLFAACQTFAGDTIPVYDGTLLGDPVNLPACVVDEEYVAKTTSVQQAFGNVVLLGDPLAAATYVREDRMVAKNTIVAEHIPFSVYASMPLPQPSSPGLPEHSVE